MHRITRYSIPAALCVTLLTASPGIAAAVSSPERPSVTFAGQTVPGSEALLAQAQSLAAAAEVVEPVTDLLSAVLKSPNGKVSEAELAAVKKQLEPAFAELRQSLPESAKPPPAPYRRTRRWRSR